MSRGPFFFFFSLFKTTEICFGPTKMEIFYREKIRKNDFAPLKNIPLTPQVWALALEAGNNSLARCVLQVDNSVIECLRRIWPWKKLMALNFLTPGAQMALEILGVFWILDTGTRKNHGRIMISQAKLDTADLSPMSDKNSKSEISDLYLLVRSDTNHWYVMVWGENKYTAKLLFHQSPTRHSDYTVTTTVTM